jgi:hypothetical protein
MTKAAAFDAVPLIGDVVLMALFLLVALPTTGANTNCCTFAPTVMTILGYFVVDLVEDATILLIDAVSEDVTFIG